EAVGPEGPVVVKVPFAITDLNNWRQAERNYRDNPEKTARAFEMLIKTQDPDWSDLDAVRGEVFDSTDMDMIKRAIRNHVQGQMFTVVLQGAVEDHFPLDKPAWDPNIPASRARLERYQQLILFGIRAAIPKAINWSKLYEIKQDRKENPTDF
ncbi:hypothetical protein N327_12927, partial [Fulmarus glacialis]